MSQRIPLDNIFSGRFDYLTRVPSDDINSQLEENTQW
jgi:hypothetical protein